MRRLVVLVAVMLPLSIASAQTWVEVGDAPDLLPAQVTDGTGPLTLINGSLLTGNDADLYCIYIDDYANFSATTVNLTSIDTRLYLFDPVSGNGITFNDDDPGGGGLQSTITGQFLTANGEYALGISAYGRDAQNAAGQNIWNSTPYNVERIPDGPGAPGPLAMWGGSGYGDGDYGIGITGATFCIPEPASLSLLALAGLALLRRR